jgi:hypothetical protein
MTTSSSASDGSPSIVATPLTSPEVSSNESSPVSKMPDLNNLSCYFTTSPVDEDAPKIPTRAPSHTKKSSERIARKRSLSKVATPKSSVSSRKLSSSTNSYQSPMSPGNAPSPNDSISTTLSSLNMFSPNPDAVAHPFGNELAQVSELAEEYGLSKQQQKLTVFDEEEQELMAMGLYKFAADDYMNELQGLFITAFGDLPQQPTTVWI